MKIKVKAIKRCVYSPNIKKKSRQAKCKGRSCMTRISHSVACLVTTGICVQPVHRYTNKSPSVSCLKRWYATFEVPMGPDTNLHLSYGIGRWNVMICSSFSTLMIMMCLKQRTNDSHRRQRFKIKPRRGEGTFPYHYHHWLIVDYKSKEDNCLYWADVISCQVDLHRDLYFLAQISN